jgi:hypothetical protein
MCSKLSSASGDVIGPQYASAAIGHGRLVELIGIIPVGNELVTTSSVAWNMFYAVERPVDVASFA